MQMSFLPSDPPLLKMHAPTTLSAATALAFPVVAEAEADPAPPPLVLTFAPSVPILPEGSTEKETAAANFSDELFLFSDREEGTAN